MTEENKRENIGLFLREVADALDSARVLLEAGHFKRAVSGAYYSALHAGRALLLADGIEAKTHAGVQNRIYVRFVRTGRLDPRTAALLQRIEADRLNADYEPSSVYTREMAQESLADAERYGDAVRRILSDMGYA